MTRIVEVTQKVPPAVAQQVFTVGSAIAGGLAGFVLAKRLTDVKEVPVPPLVVATLVSAVFTLGAAIMQARSLEKEY